MSTEDLISRSEALGGNLGGRSAKQASAVLSLIEGQSAYLAAQARLATAPYLTEQAIGERHQAFLDALALRREPPVPPTVQDVERWAPFWAALVPDNPGLRALVARLLGRKYRLPRRHTPRLQAALGLADPDVTAAFTRLAGASPASIYTEQLATGERLRWWWARLGAWLDELPPFWTSFALTLTNTVGSSILALPIAIAQIGPLAGVALLIVLGLVNVVTIAWMAEALTRTSAIRYGKTYTGRLVGEYLGGTSATVLSIATFFYCVLALFSYYLGFGTTLAGATALPVWFWVAVLFAANVYFVRRRSLNATVASALVTGALNIGLILVISLLAFDHADPARWRYVALPGLAGQPWNPTVLQLVFGVVLGVYAGHLSVSNCAQIVLRRDPGGRSLIHGAVAALLVAIALFCVWVMAVGGALDRQALVDEPGTALVPLAARLGTPVYVLGTIYILFGIGMISIHAALGLFNLCREWLAVWMPGEAGAWRTPLLLSPMTAVFLLTEWLILTGGGSFTLVTSLRGAIVAPLLAGVFPALLLLASRRKGELVPGALYRWLGHPLLVGGVYGLFLASLLLHGAVIWSDLPRRATALLVFALLLGLSVWLVRGGLLRRRLVFELRHDERKGYASGFVATSGGEAVSATVRLQYPGSEQQISGSSGPIPQFGALRSARVLLPSDTTSEVKVAAYRVMPTGDTAGLPGTVTVHAGAEARTVDLPIASGQYVVQLPAAPHEVELSLNERR